jgi:hypothetical protein
VDLALLGGCECAEEMFVTLFHTESEMLTGYRLDWESDLAFITPGHSGVNCTDLLRLNICPSLTLRRCIDATASLVQRHRATTFTSNRCLHSSGLPSVKQRRGIVMSAVASTVSQTLALFAKFKKKNVSRLVLY